MERLDCVFEEWIVTPTGFESDTGIVNPRIPLQGDVEGRTLARLTFTPDSATMPVHQFLAK
jgi:hypothetical protein